MIEIFSYLIISVVTLCFGFLVGFQLAHIQYVRRLAGLARRCVETGTLAPLLVELGKENKSAI